ncbi:MAG: hypothetical protein WCW16_05700 [Candidatus Magasanikbacteria bacterium]
MPKESREMAVPYHEKQTPTRRHNLFVVPPQEEGLDDTKRGIQQRELENKHFPLIASELEATFVSEDSYGDQIDNLLILIDEKENKIKIKHGIVEGRYQQDSEYKSLQRLRKLIGEARKKLAAWENTRHAQKEDARTEFVNFFENVLRDEAGGQGFSLDTVLVAPHAANMESGTEELK